MFIVLIIVAIWDSERWLQYLLTSLVLLVCGCAIVGVKKA